MWKRDRENGKIAVSIIITGWECAHYVMEGRFHAKVKAALNERIGSEVTAKLLISEAFDHKYMQVLDMEYLERDKIHWVDMASENKKLIDSAFKALFILSTQ